MSGRGKLLERELGAIHAAYMAEGTAFIVRQEVPTQQIGRKLVRVKRAVPDFFGFISQFFQSDRWPDRFQPSCSSVLFDCKMTIRNRWPKSRGGGLETHQLDLLEKHSSMGGLSFVYVAYMPNEKRGDRVDYILDIGKLELCSATIPIAEMEEHGLRVHGCDWLEAVEEHWI